ncbi:ABC transporter permease subunit [Arthrobacter sp.]|uniref:amino acid ABC transporter permease n=1 Tax=Arthrobacter sp. TaxID=1667 RepID=UPI0033988005
MIELLNVLLAGVPQTVSITASAFAVGAVLGLPLAMLRHSSIDPLRWGATAIVDLVRTVPPIVWLFIIYYGVGSGSLRLSTYQAATVGLGLVAAAHLSEIYRAGLEAVPPGQWDAVRALGVPPVPTYSQVILPQAMIVVVPPMASFAIALLKDSAVASVIGATDIAYRAVQQTQMDLNGLANFGMAGLLYIVLSIPIAVVARGADRMLLRKLTGL